MIFQEPMTALNPLMTIGRQIDEMVEIHLSLPRREREARIVALLEEVRLDDPQRIMRAYPHELRRAAPARDDRDGADPRAGDPDCG